MAEMAEQCEYGCDGPCGAIRHWADRALHWCRCFFSMAGERDVAVAELERVEGERDRERADSDENYRRAEQRASEVDQLQRELTGARAELVALRAENVAPEHLRTALKSMEQAERIVLNMAEMNPEHRKTYGAVLDACDAIRAALAVPEGEGSHVGRTTFPAGAEGEGPEPERNAAHRAKSEGEGRR